MLAKEEILLIVYFIVVILLLTAFAIVFFVTFQKRKNKLLYEKMEAEKRFQRELVQSKLEIQEQTLKNVSWELHDNIGQLLSVANMQLNMLTSSVDEALQSNIKDVQEVVSSSLQEVRALSKSLNNEVVEYAGLEASVKSELARFERLNILNTSFVPLKDSLEIPQEDEIILFRILQEFFSNVIKHSKAGNLKVEFNITEDRLHISAADDGLGFNPEEVEKSSGMFNMSSRAKLINADFNLNSSIGKGTSVSLRYPIKTHQNE
ncbi:histidine kinase [Gillisia sp. M10.2A]|uniref:histidine kinase n=1 Tax=Gillisia lutea TaxID=2909668 RepID=A0ABS9EI94_9FLAO|nr:histidine kinase [Gillisia lutea]MCF4102582.1 histidine kinase [Gillisia lutea]